MNRQIANTSAVSRVVFSQNVIFIKCLSSKHKTDAYSFCILRTYLTKNATDCLLHAAIKVSNLKPEEI